MFKKFFIGAIATIFVISHANAIDLGIKIFGSYLNSVQTSTPEVGTKPATSKGNTKGRGYFVNAEVDLPFWFIPGVSYDLKSFFDNPGPSDGILYEHQLSAFYDFGPKFIRARLGYTWQADIFKDAAGNKVASVENRSLLYAGLLSTIGIVSARAIFKTGLGLQKDKNYSTEFNDLYVDIEVKVFKFLAVKLGYDRVATKYKNGYVINSLFGGIGIVF